MERDRAKEPRAEELEDEDMDTSGHGDKLQDAVDRVAQRNAPQKEGEPKLERVDEDDMDTSGHGDKLRTP